jgi:hypothetical protein
MSMSTKVFGTLGLALMALGMQLPANAQIIEAPTAATQPVEMQSTEAQTEAQTILPIAPVEVAPVEAIAPTSWTQPESLSAAALQPESAAAEQPATPEADQLTYPAAEDSQELAQARRRTRNTVNSPSFIGIGGDFGYAGDASFAVISKFSVSDKVSLRPSVLIGDDLSVLVPVTYDFSSYSTDVAGFRFLPYAGVGASYQDSSDNENFNLLLAAGADVPLSRQFTLNAQANVGVLNGTDFGVTVGVGYNFGNAFR